MAEKLKELQQQGSLEGHARQVSSGVTKGKVPASPASHPTSTSLNDAYVESRLDNEASMLTKMMKVIHPNPVKMFACGQKLCSCYSRPENCIWCDDDPHPKLMNGTSATLWCKTNRSSGSSMDASSATEPGASSVDIFLDDHRVYWTEHELRAMANEKNRSGDQWGIKSSSC